MAIDVLFSALAEPTRRKILEELKDEPLAVGALVERLEISQPTVSKHLKVLREAALVSMTAQGQRRIYNLNAEAIEDLGQWCSGMLPEPEPSAFAAPQTAVELVTLGGESPALSSAAQQLGRTMGRGLGQVTGRAHELLERFPRFGRKR